MVDRHLKVHLRCIVWHVLTLFVTRTHCWMIHFRYHQLHQLTTSSNHVPIQLAAVRLAATNKLKASHLQRKRLRLKCKRIAKIHLKLLGQQMVDCRLGSALNRNQFRMMRKAKSDILHQAIMKVHMMMVSHIMY